MIKKNTSLYLNEIEQKQVKEVAKKLGLSFSSFCRMSILKRVGEENLIFDLNNGRSNSS